MMRLLTGDGQKVDFVDETIDAELPNKDEDSWLYDFVIEHQLHICNDEYCRTEPGGKCRHGFPKKFQKVRL
ncbi:unnamed protein product [Bursaphelenchus xylophilus]|uniref:(pine wood nematode) hypothetical protein n=1 Tax=Bursaphelenchus xylophilus TaxID=6326 RepID=A0A1I7SNQ4_BURXY|nr:unnamed protein product [Bursaphelenchus xylophilus]CAG9081351.1 unnamed protein product [Bursaphelenchus xylophilus]